jgi:hypothetical protein
LPWPAPPATSCAPAVEKDGIRDGAWVLEATEALDLPT